MKANSAIKNLLDAIINLSKQQLNIFVYRIIYWFKNWIRYVNIWKSKYLMFELYIEKLWR